MMKVNKQAPVLVGSRRCVYNGSAIRTSGGLKKEDILKIQRTTRIVRSKSGTETPKPVFAYVPKKKHALGKVNLWAQAIKEARKKLKLTGFVKVEKGTDFYNTAKKIHTRLKKKASKASGKAAAKGASKGSTKERKRKSKTKKPKTNPKSQSTNEKESAPKTKRVRKTRSKAVASK